MLVDDCLRCQPARGPDHRPRHHLEQQIDGIGATPGTGQQGQQALGKKRQQRHLDDGAQDADDEDVWIGHDIVPNDFPCLVKPMNYEHWRHYARAWLLHFFGREEQAFAEYATAYRLKPDDVQAARHLAFIAAQKKRFAAAEQWYMETLRLAPEDAETHFNLGFVREQMGNSRDAVSSFGEAARLKPNLDRAWYGLGLAHARLGEHPAAAAAFDKAVELQPMNAEAFYQLGMALHHANDPARVKDVVERLVGFDPKRAKKLVQDAERADLMPLIPELPF